MECASTILASILSKAAEYLVEPILRRCRYLYCFESIVEELEEEDTNLRLAQESVQNEVDRERRNAKEIEGEVQNWLTQASNVAANVQSLKQEIDANDSRLNRWCSNWCCKYKLSERAAEQTSKLLKLRNACKFNNIAHSVVPLGIEFLTSKDFMTFESTKFAFDEIIEALKDDEISVVGLYGMGGIGKTTLAKAVRNAAIEQKLFDTAIRVVVSQNVNIMTLQEQIADLLDLKFEQKSDQRRAEQLSRRLKEGEKILLILDDMWKMLDLTTIGNLFGARHITCKILMTTRNERVCIAMDCQKKVKLNFLNQKEGMDLIKKHAGVRDDSTTFNDAARKVLEECKGLPLAIATIGRLLRGQSVEEWEVVYQKLQRSKLDDVEGIDVDVYASLRLSYDYLKSNETKLCFLLCSLFPEDYEIDLEELLCLGYGLHLFQDGDSIDDARLHLKTRINYLKDSCLLLDEEEERFVKMHDLIRDVALRIASEKENVFLVKAGMRLAEWPQLEDIEQCTAISLMQTKIDVFPNQLVCPKLEILLSDGDDVSNEFFEALKALKVARLKGFHLSLNSLQSLTNLVTLWLIDCKLRDMSMLKMLVKLEILILNGCELDELPEELRELNKLRMLSMENCLVLKGIPINVIPSLSRLEELLCTDNSFIAWEAEGISAESSNTSLSELSNMTQQHMRPSRGFLENLETLPMQDYDRMSCLFPASSIQGLQKLKKVTISYCNELKIVFQLEGLWHIKENSSLLSSLTSLDLYALPNLRYIWKGPTQQLSLQSLTVVKIDNCENLRYVFTLNLARSLLRLEQLEVSDCDNLKHIVEIKAEETKDNVATGGGNDVLLPKLKILQLADLKRLINFCPENYSSTWPALQELHLDRTPSLVAELGANLQTVKTLRVLEIGSTDKFKNNFKNLKELYISDCGEVQVIFQLEQQFSLPNLKKLNLSYLEELECLYKGPTHLLSLPNLQQLEVKSCKRLRHLLSSTLAQNLLQLEKIYIIGCGELEQVMVEDDREDHVQLPLFPNLSFINVKICDKLKVLFPVSIARLHLQQLTSLKIEGSPISGNLLSSSLARNMLQLKMISIWGCGELEQVMVEDDREDHVHLPLLPSLSFICVHWCVKLKTLFPVSIARLHLQQLTSLEIGESPKLEEIFGHGDETDMTGDTQLVIVLPLLKGLMLYDLGSLVTFCPSGYHLIFPSLSRLWLSELPKITTRFSVDENGAVHAQAKAPHTHNQGIVDIDCWRSGEIRQKLPPYTGK